MSTRKILYPEIGKSKPATQEQKSKDKNNLFHNKPMSLSLQPLPHRLGALAPEGLSSLDQGNASRQRKSSVYDPEPAISIPQGTAVNSNFEAKYSPPTNSSRTQTTSPGLDEYGELRIIAANGLKKPPTPASTLRKELIRTSPSSKGFNKVSRLPRTRPISNAGQVGQIRGSLAGTLPRSSSDLYSFEMGGYDRGATSAKTLGSGFVHFDFDTIIEDDSDILGGDTSRSGRFSRQLSRSTTTDLAKSPSGETGSVTAMAKEDPPRATYLAECTRRNLVPIGYFMRHIHDKQFRMHHHGVGESGAKAIAASLSNNMDISSLDLMDNSIGPEGGRALFEMLKENPYITHLDLSNNPIGPLHISLLYEALQYNPAMVFCNLSGTGLDDSAAPEFANILLLSSRLETLNLSRNRFTEKAGGVLGPALSENSVLRDLDLSWNQIRGKGSRAFIDGIAKNIVMKKLNLAWNGLGPVLGAQEMAKALRVNTVLEELDLSNNRITTEGAVLLGRSLAVNETLRSLRVGNNPMCTAGIYAMCAGLMRNQQGSGLKVIYFDNITMNKDARDISEQVHTKYPELLLHFEGEEVAVKRKPPTPPIRKLARYLEKRRAHLIEFFTHLDKDNSSRVSRSEFIQGIMTLFQEEGLTLNEEEAAEIANALDTDGDGDINYAELAVGTIAGEYSRPSRDIVHVMPTSAPSLRE